MANTSKVGYWQSRGAFGTTHQGRQYTLAVGPDDRPDGPTYRAALARFQQIVRGSDLPLTLDDCIGPYLLYVKRELQPATAVIRGDRLKAVCETFGKRHVSGLSVREVLDWAHQRRERGWSNSTLRLTLSSFKACLNWAKEAGLIDAHPLAKLKLPPDGCRGLEYVLTDGQVDALVRESKWPVRELLLALRDTGARPSEIIEAEARHFDPCLNALVYQANARPGEKRPKTARKGRARVIYLTGETLANVVRLVQEHPIGPLFRGSPQCAPGPGKGERKGWTLHSYRQAILRVARRAGVPKLIGYSFRHTYAVRWLRAGESADALAEVLGTSIAMIRTNYGHLADQHDYLRRLVEKMARPSGNT